MRESVASVEGVFEVGLGVGLEDADLQAVRRVNVSVRRRRERVMGKYFTGMLQLVLKFQFRFFVGGVGVAVWGSGVGLWVCYIYIDARGMRRFP